MTCNALRTSRLRSFLKLTLLGMSAKSGGMLVNEVSAMAAVLARLAWKLKSPSVWAMRALSRALGFTPIMAARILAFAFWRAARACRLATIIQ